MIPVEQIQPGDTVLLPNGREMPVSHLEVYGDDYVVVYKDGDLEKTLRMMRAGDLVNAERPEGNEPLGIGARFDADAQRAVLLGLYRRHGPMPDSEIVERVHEQEADNGTPLTPVSTLMRRRRELERNHTLQANSERFHPESGATEPLWMIRPADEQTTIAREYQPEPDF